MGGIRLHVLISNVKLSKLCACVCVYPFSVSRNGRTNCAAIDVVRDTLGMCFTQNKRVVHLHVSTRVYIPLFCTSGTTGHNTPKFGMWAEGPTSTWDPLYVCYINYGLGTYL